jgi:membrane protein implicated in regulation of membrane protease activity
MSNLDGDRIVGSLGLVTTRVAGGQGAGEVQVQLRGGSESFIAYAADPIERGEQILVVGRRPGRILDVMRFNE